MAIKRHGELEYCEFQMLEIGGFAISSFEKYRLVSLCPFLMFPGKKGDRWSRKATGSVPQHARFRILQTLVLYVVRTQI